MRIAASIWTVGIFASVFGACSAGGSSSPSAGGGSGGAVGDDSGPGGFDATLDTSSGGSGGGGIIPDPETCDQAANSHTYVGCDFYPTVTDNIVRPDFDFAVVVANTGNVEAQVTVTRGGAPAATATVPPNGLAKVYLPWVEELKSLSWIPGQPDNGCATWVKTKTVDAKGGAYHLTSTRPVAVYQFNAIEYAGKGGPPGKDWTPCEQKKCLALGVQCFSYTNDASLLLPVTALSGNYRIGGAPYWTDSEDPSSSFTYPPYFAVTGTRDGTVVTVHTSATGGIAAGGGVPATPGGGTASFPIDAGEVVMVVGTATSDFSGTLLNATAPVQVITGIACTNMPHETAACDHLEESVLPVETLGQHYFVAAPTGPDGNPATQVVRLFGNVDGTQLTYPGANPGGPAVINAGEMIDLGPVSQNFEIVGDHELTVATFLVGAGPMSGPRKGDPSQSFVTTVEQYRLKYVFLAPDDYDVSYADVIQPLTAEVTVDGAPSGVTPTELSSGYGIARVKLGPGNAGAHVLEATAPVGIQVIGYGDYTSYQYPGGLNLGFIAPPPVK